VKTATDLCVATGLRDYLLRFTVIPLLGATLLVGFSLAQAPDEYGMYFPPGKSPEAAAQQFGKLRRLILQGSGPDRVRVRQDMMQLGADAVPLLLADLESGNQLNSWTASLVLGELRDRRALDAFGRVVSEQSRGETFAASLALGRYDDSAAFEPLLIQLLSGRSREARRAAAFAIGRLQAPQSVAKLAEVAREAKQQVDLAAALVALGMTGNPAAIAEIAPRTKATDDRVRRAAVVALGLLPASEEGEQLALARLADEDPQVLIAALGALACTGSAGTATALQANSHLVGHSDDRVRAALVLAVSARAPADCEGFLAKRLTDQSERVRAAAIGGLAAAAKPHGDALAVKGLEDSQHSRVRLTSIVTLAVLAGRRGDSLELSPFIDDRDAEVRDAAIVAHAWLNGPAARPTLMQVRDARKEDRLVRRAREILQTLEVSPELAHRLLRARLQVLLDDAGVAPSWNAHRLANEQIIITLGLENALPEFGGAGATGEHSAAAAARRVPPRLEDVRRHLDVFPYSDKRLALEVPLLRIPHDR
jgi:HEAT repeat protein